MKRKFQVRQSSDIPPEEYLLLMSWINSFVILKCSPEKKDHPPSFLHYSINFRKVKIYFNIGCGGHSVENIQANVLCSFTRFDYLSIMVSHRIQVPVLARSILFFRIWYCSSLIHPPSLSRVQLIKYGWFNHSLREFPVYVIFSAS